MCRLFEPPHKQNKTKRPADTKRNSYKIGQPIDFALNGQSMTMTFLHLDRKDYECFLVEYVILLALSCGFEEAADKIDNINANAGSNFGMNLHCKTCK